MGQLDVRPAKIRNGILTHVDDRQSQDECDGQTGIDDDAPAGDRVALGEIGIEVVLICVAGQKREPGGVRLTNRATKWMLVHSVDVEVFKEPAKLSRNDGGFGQGLQTFLTPLTPAILHAIHEV